jgi:hypothetical protein
MTVSDLSSNCRDGEPRNCCYRGIDRDESQYRHSPSRRFAAPKACPRGTVVRRNSLNQIERLGQCLIETRVSRVGATLLHFGTVPV